MGRKGILSASSQAALRFAEAVPEKLKVAAGVYEAEALGGAAHRDVQAAAGQPDGEAVMLTGLQDRLERGLVAVTLLAEGTQVKRQVAGANIDGVYARH